MTRMEVTMEVASRRLAARALEVTEETKVCSEVAGKKLGTRDELEDEKLERMRAIRHVKDTGQMYRPLIDKWKRK